MRLFFNLNLDVKYSKYIEGTLDPKYCGELITTDNRRMLLEMPGKYSLYSLDLIVFQGWPVKKKYEADHWNHKYNENFHITASSSINFKLK